MYFRMRFRHLVLRNYAAIRINVRLPHQTRNFYRNNLTRTSSFELSPVIDAFPFSIPHVTTSLEYHEIAGILRNRRIKIPESWQRHRSEIKCPTGVITKIYYRQRSHHREM